MTPKEALDFAITKVPSVGRPADLARALGISPAAIAVWDGRVPAARVQAVVTACGGAVTAEQLRPDIYTECDAG